jgi:hypothetical protein
MSIPQRPESRLILTEARPPFWTIEGDYSVMWRSTKVGHIRLRITSQMPAKSIRAGAGFSMTRNATA